jgi:hypothetical protein
MGARSCATVTLRWTTRLSKDPGTDYASDVFIGARLEATQCIILADTARKLLISSVRRSPMQLQKHILIAFLVVSLRALAQSGSQTIVQPPSSGVPTQLWVNSLDGDLRH